jgi:NAD-dependent dihydropyrimidine dehydrogenase PreA subunit
VVQFRNHTRLQGGRGMILRDFFGHLYDVVFRMLPHRDKTGLMKIGNPRRDSPVLVTGNYTETVRRLRKALKGENVWLLVANSKGINVWCAAGGGHLTHHDVISAVVTSGAEAKIDNHELVLPQLGATGIERQKITEATGWTTIWGPARLEDLPSFLHQGRRATPRQRFMRFPLWERLEIAVMWVIPMIIIGILLFALLGGWRVGFAVGVVVCVLVFGIFAALPWIRVTGQLRWVTFSLFALSGFAFGSMVLWIFGGVSVRDLSLTGTAAVVAMALLSIDLTGTTPWYGSNINTFRNQAHIDLVADRCTGVSECVQVCPRNVFRMNALERRVEVVLPADCIQCGACIVQCPRDALRFRYDDGRIVEPGTIRRTRMNMVGRRTVQLPEKKE